MGASAEFQVEIDPGIALDPRGDREKSDGEISPGSELEHRFGRFSASREPAVFGEETPVHPRRIEGGVVIVLQRFAQTVVETLAHFPRRLAEIVDLPRDEPIDLRFRHLGSARAPPLRCELSDDPSDAAHE